MSGDPRQRKADLSVEDDLIRITWRTDTVVTLTDADDHLAEVAAAVPGERRPVLVDIRGIRSIERAARTRLADQRVASKVALLVESPLSRTIGSILLGLNRSVAPLRLFTDEATAREWLLADRKGRSRGRAERPRGS